MRVPEARTVQRTCNAEVIMQTPSNKAIAPVFPIGAVVYTAGVDILTRQGIFKPLQYLYRHLCGDWGDLCEEDQQANQNALELGNRLLSSYQVHPDLKIWIITEADRSVTTILLPDEY